MKKCIEPNMNFEETGFFYSMSLISGKYKLPILYFFLEFYTSYLKQCTTFCPHVEYKKQTHNLFIFFVHYKISLISCQL